ncbi:MAG: flagellum-specific ATP synthase [Phenylobacterium sp.]|jgi:flagellum-specific ATP synthase
MERYLTAVAKIPTRMRHGSVLQSIGLVIEATCPGVFVGELCRIHPVQGHKTIVAEVVGFKPGKVLLMPYEKVRGITHGSLVEATGEVALARVDEKLLGRVVDAFGEPLDGGPSITFSTSLPIYREPINPLARKRITEVVPVGIKAIDTFITLGKGQRIGLFAGSGVGKSTLLSSVCKNLEGQINVIALIGERGREVEEFVNDTLGPEGLKKSIVVAATAEQPPLVRAHAVYTACAMAEYFSNQGRDVLFTMDSITRFAMALREVGLAIGEPPTTKGYTTSVFAAIPDIVERCGQFNDRGAITAIFTILVEGDDFNDPVVDALRAILDGHIVLTRELAERGHYPAIDVLKSTSRLFNRLNDVEKIALTRKAKVVLAKYQDSRELIEIGAFSQDNATQTQLVKQWQSLMNFLSQDAGVAVSLDDAWLGLTQVGF